MTFGSIFAGIGGLDLGFERAGMQCKWQVEINPYCQKILEKHWPNVRRWGDVRTWPQPDTEPVDVICGGFPCQDVSKAGKRVGIHGERSGLYKQMLSVVRSLRPKYVVLENVDGLRSDGLTVVLSDLADSGYDAEWEVISACTFSAPHTRRRVFIVAYPNGDGLQGSERRVEQEGERKEAGRVFEGSHTPTRFRWQQLPTPVFCRGSHGISNRVERTRCLGNAVVPQVAEYIGRRIIEHV